MQSNGDISVNKLEVRSKGGAKFSRLGGLAWETILHETGEMSDETGETRRTVFYIHAGICSITTRVRDIHNSYEEVTCPGNPKEIFQQVAQQVRKLNEDILGMGCVAVFCTVYPMHIQTWNECRFMQGKTCTLFHRDAYARQQRNMEEAIAMINAYIVQVNQYNCVSTPMTHRCLQHNTKKGTKYWKYTSLIDGCHPDDKVLLKVLRALVRAMELNKK